MLLIFLLMLLLVVLGGVFVHQSFSLWAPSWVWLRWAITLINLLGITSIVISFLGRESLSTEALRVLTIFGTSWLFVFFYCVLGSLMLRGLSLIPWLRPYLTESKFVSIGFLLALAIIFAGGYIKYQTKERVALNLHINKPLPRPIKIVGISDLHLGYTIGREEVARWVDMINQEKADLILIAGDIIDNSTRPVIEDKMYEELSRLTAPLGVYAVLGNHEYMGNEARTSKVLGRTPIKLLRDESVLVSDSFYIVGRDDRMNRHRSSVQDLVRGLDHTKPIILLDHQPYNLEQAEQAGIDLQLSGHTHRGQVFPINLIVDKMYEKSHGYLRKGTSHFYISSGIGIWGGKFRISTQSEYVCITLQGNAV